MEDKTLFLVVPNPPYQPGEEFLSHELPQLAASFDQIVIIHHNKDYKYNSIPYVSSFLYFPYLPSTTEKIKSLRHIISPVFWGELAVMILHYRLFPTAQRIASVLGGIEIGKKFARFVLVNANSLKKNKIYVYSYWCNFIAIGLAFLKQRAAPYTCISRAHGYDVFFERNESHYLPLRRFIFKNLDRVYFISENGLNYSINRTGNYPSMRVSYLGSSPLVKKPSRQADSCHIISCSRIIPLKRIHLIVDALALLCTKIKVRWAHFGNGPLLEEIQAYARLKLSKKENVSYEFKGYVSNEQLLDYYSKNSIDLFINVSESEGLPFSIIEAFSAGIPALATDVGGTREIVESTKNGTLLEPNLTAEELKKNIEYFITLDTHSKTIYSAKAYERWRDSFDADRNFQIFIRDFI